MSDTTVQCDKCQRTERVTMTEALQRGWPKCHGLTMRLTRDHPDVYKATMEALVVLAHRASEARKEAATVAALGGASAFEWSDVVYRDSKVTNPLADPGDYDRRILMVTVRKALARIESEALPSVDLLAAAIEATAQRPWSAMGSRAHAEAILEWLREQGK